MINLVESGGADLPTQAEIFIPGGRGVPRSDPSLGGRHPDHRGGVRKRHRRRGVRAGHVRLHDHGQGTGGGLPGRAAAGEDGHRRGDRRRVPRRRDHARHHVRPGRLRGRRRAGRPPPGPARHRPRRTDQPPLTGRPARPGCGNPPLRSRPRSCSASPAPICGCPTTRGRCWPGSSTAPTSTSSSPPTAQLWSPAGPSCTATRWASSPTPAACLFSEEAQKATQFIQLANAADIPLLFLQNTTGYMVGTRVRAAAASSSTAR